MSHIDKDFRHPAYDSNCDKYQAHLQEALQQYIIFQHLDNSKCLLTNIEKLIISDGIS